MQRLIDDLLKLSSLESTNKIIDKEQVPVADILSNVIEEAEVLSGMMRHKFIVNVDKNLYLIGNQKEIFTIFSNELILFYAGDDPYFTSKQIFDLLKNSVESDEKVIMYPNNITKNPIKIII